MEVEKIVAVDSGQKSRAKFDVLLCGRCNTQTPVRRCLELAAVVLGEPEPRSIGLSCPRCWNLQNQEQCLELYTLSLLGR